MYWAWIDVFSPFVFRICAVTPSGCSVKDMNSWPNFTAMLGIVSATDLSSGSSVYWEMIWYGSSGIEPSVVASRRALASATVGWAILNSGGLIRSNSRYVSIGQSGGYPAARTVSARPRRRKISIVRGLQRSIFGYPSGASFFSISVQRTPRLPRSMASVSPTGPAPTMSTCVSIHILCGRWFCGKRQSPNNDTALPEQIFALSCAGMSSEAIAAICERI